MRSGYKQTAEHRARLSAALTGRVISAEHLAAMTGWKHTAESKAKMSATKLKMNEESGYGAVHKRARKRLDGQLCAYTDNTCQGRAESVFSHDTPPEFVRTDVQGRWYSVREMDYLRLCQSHHHRYDAETQALVAATKPV